MKSRAKTIMSGKGRGIGKKLGAFGRVISQHKKITALCSLLLFAGAFALIFSDTYKPSEAAAPPLSQLRALNTSGLSVANQLAPTPAQLTAFDSKVNAGGTVTIANQGDLLALAQRVNAGNDFAGRNFELGANIELSGSKPTYGRTAVSSTVDDYFVSGSLSNVWTPIGNVNNKFRGNFDGKGFTISNMTSFESGGEGVGGTITTEAHAGLFGFVENGTIQNLNMTNPVAIAQQQTFSQAGSVVGKTTGQVINNTVSNAIVASGSDDSFAGGTAGSLNNSAITLNDNDASGIIVSAGTVNQTTQTTSPIDTLSGQAGGIVGGLGVGSSLTIDNSNFTGGTVLSNQMAGEIAFILSF